MNRIINMKNILHDWLWLSAGVLLASVVWYVAGFSSYQDRAKLAELRGHHAHLTRIEEVGSGIAGGDYISMLAGMIDHACQNRLRNIDREQPVQLILINFPPTGLAQLQRMLRERCPGVRFDCKLAASEPESMPEPPYLIVAADIETADPAAVRTTIAAGTVPVRRCYRIKTDGSQQMVNSESGAGRP